MDSKALDIESLEKVDSLKGIKVALPKEFFLGEMDDRVKEKWINL